MYRIRRFGVIRTATVAAVMYAIGFAILFVPIALLGLAVQPGGRALAGVIVLGLLLIVVYPLVIWIATALACLLYNLTARWVGGIEVDVERKPPPWAGSTPWQQPPTAWGTSPAGWGGTPNSWGPGPTGWAPPPGPAQAAPPLYGDQPYLPQPPSERPPVAQPPTETDAPGSSRPEG